MRTGERAERVERNRELPGAPGQAGAFSAGNDVAHGECGCIAGQHHTESSAGGAAVGVGLGHEQPHVVRPRLERELDGAAQPGILRQRTAHGEGANCVDGAEHVAGGVDRGEPDANRIGRAPIGGGAGLEAVGPHGEHREDAVAAGCGGADGIELKDQREVLFEVLGIGVGDQRALGGGAVAARERDDLVHGSIVQRATVRPLAPLARHPVHERVHDRHRGGAFPLEREHAESRIDCGQTVQARSNFDTRNLLSNQRRRRREPPACEVNDYRAFRHGVYPARRRRFVKLCATGAAHARRRLSVPQVHEPEVLDHPPATDDAISDRRHRHRTSDDQLIEDGVVAAIEIVASDRYPRALGTPVPIHHPELPHRIHPPPQVLRQPFPRPPERSSVAAMPERIHPVGERSGVVRRRAAGRVTNTAGRGRSHGARRQRVELGQLGNRRHVRQVGPVRRAPVVAGALDAVEVRRRCLLELAHLRPGPRHLECGHRRIAAEHLVGTKRGERHAVATKVTLEAAEQQLHPRPMRRHGCGGAYGPVENLGIVAG